MQKHTIEEAEQLLLNVPISELVPPFYGEWGDEKGRVCPIRYLADMWGIGDYDVLPSLGMVDDVYNVASVYDRSSGRREGVLRVISWLREHGSCRG